jgi:hypothetical protein
MSKKWIIYQSYHIRANLSKGGSATMLWDSLQKILASKKGIVVTVARVWALYKRKELTVLAGENFSVEEGALCQSYDFFSYQLGFVRTLG